MNISKKLISIILTILIVAVGGVIAGDDVVEIISDIQTELQSQTLTEEQSTESSEQLEFEQQSDQSQLDQDGYYYSKEDVSLYINTYSELPKNFVTKQQAGGRGWEGGSVENYIEGAAIGGDTFQNYEKLLPEKSGRVYYECDIDTDSQSSRGAKRIVFSNDGLIYYTDDHYESFELLYGEE